MFEHYDATFENEIKKLFDEKKEQYNQNWEQYFENNFDKSFEDGDRFKNGNSREALEDIINVSCPFFNEYNRIKSDIVYENDIVGSIDADGQQANPIYKKIYGEISKYFDEYFDKKLTKNMAKNEK